MSNTESIELNNYMLKFNFLAILCKLGLESELGRRRLNLDEQIAKIVQQQQILEKISFSSNPLLPSENK